MNTHEQETKRGTSASNAAADRLCPGRFIMCKGLPDVPTEWSEHGQKIHAALAENGRTGQEVSKHLTPDQADMVEAHREIEKKVITQIWGGEPDNSNRVWREQRYWCRVPHEMLQHYIHSGQADMVMRRINKVLIQDYKSLSGDIPDSPKNEQLRDLAVMVWRTLTGVDEVYVCINQPLVTWTPELCKYTKPELEQAEQEMWDRVRKSNDPNSPRIAGEVQCKYCKAKGVCKEYAAWSASLLPEKPSPLSTAMASWTPQERAVVAEQLPRLKTLLEAAEAHLKGILETDPEGVPGFYLKPGITRETITDPQELFNRFTAIAQNQVLSDLKEEYSKAKNIDQGILENSWESMVQERILSMFMACVKITKKELEGALRAVTKAKGKGLKNEMEKILTGIVESKQNAPSLAKKEDE